MRSFKTILFPLIFIIIYIWLIFTVFFGDSDISNFGTTIGLQILLIIVGFLAIQTIPLGSKSTLFKLISLLGLTLSFIARSTYSIQHAIFIFCTHIIFMVYVRDRFTLVQSSKSFYLWRSSHRGLETTSLLLAFTYISTLWVRGSNAGINLDCNKIHDQTMGVITHYLPTMQNNSGFINIINKIDTIGSQSFGQLLGIGSISSGVNPGLGNDIGGLDIGSLSILSGFSDISGLENLLSGSNIVFSGEQQPASPGILGSLLGYQQNLLNGIVNNQELINAQVCDVTLKHINTITQQNDIKLISFVLLVIYLSILMRSIMFIIGIINFIILGILFMMGWFIRITAQEECEKIDV